MTDHTVVFTPAEYMESFDAACPQRAYHDLALASPFTAPDGMPLVTRMAELIALNRHPAVHQTDGVHFNLGGKRPLIPLDLEGPSTPASASCSIRCSRPNRWPDCPARCAS